MQIFEVPKEDSCGESLQISFYEILRENPPLRNSMLTLYLRRYKQREYVGVETCIHYFYNILNLLNLQIFNKLLKISLCSVMCHCVPLFPKLVTFLVTVKYPYSKNEFHPKSYIIIIILDNLRNKVENYFN